MTATKLDLPQRATSDRDPDRLERALWATTLAWIVGMATVFPLGNDRLEAVSIFTFDRIGFLVVAALFGLAIARRPAILRQFGRIELLMALWLMLCLVSWATALPGKQAIDIKRDVNLLLTSVCTPFLAFLVARHVAWSARQVRLAVQVTLFGIGVFLVALGVVQGMVDWRFLISDAAQSVHRNRARGPFRNAIPYTAMLGLLMMIGIAVCTLERRRGWLIAVAALLAGVVEALLLGQVRIIWIAVPIGLAYLALIRPAARRAALLAAAAMVCVVGLASVGIDMRVMAAPGGAALQPRGDVAERIVDSGPVYNRVAVYATSLNMIADRPLLGYGFGARTFLDWRDPYMTSCCGVSPEWARECAIPHNEVLNVLILLGVAGLLLYLALLRELWRLLADGRRAADPTRATLAAALQAGFIMLVISAQLHDVMYLYPVQAVFFFLSGLIAPAAAVADARAAALSGEQGVE